MIRALPSSAEVVIVGGGIIGVSIAYYLAKKGMREVLLLERGMMGEGATGKCAGGIRTQFSTEINIRLSLLSLKVFEHFKEEFGVDPEFNPAGYLFLAVRKRQWAILKTNAQLMKTMGLDVELLGPSEIRGRWPFLRVDDLLGGSYSKSDGYAGPYEILQGFAKGARELGAMLIEGAEVTKIHRKRERVQAVEMATGERIVTPLVINAAGPYASRVAAMVGVELLVKPLRRQLFFTDVFEELPALFPLVIDLEHGWYMRREGKGLLLAGPEDAQSSFNEKVDFGGQEWTAARSLHRVPILQRARIVRGLAGLYDISPDHHAILGPFPEIKGFVCANGFSGHGFQHSPAIGILIAELIAEGRSKTVDIYPLRPHRFREGDLIYEPLTAFHD
ncbi:MAG: NAD(P)/FAD-dependent oxidoreductase [Desulfatiglandales bacterium]